MDEYMVIYETKGYDVSEKAVAVFVNEGGIVTVRASDPETQEAWRQYFAGPDFREFYAEQAAPLAAVQSASTNLVATAEVGELTDENRNKIKSLIPEESDGA